MANLRKFIVRFSASVAVGLAVAFLVDFFVPEEQNEYLSAIIVMAGAYLGGLAYRKLKDANWPK